MRISDWSSDVCSSDLGQGTGHGTQIRDGRTDIVQFPAVTRAASTAKISVGQRRDPNAGLTQVGKALPFFLDRKSVVEGKSVSVRVHRGGRRLIQKTIHSLINCSQLVHTVTLKQ